MAGAAVVTRHDDREVPKAVLLARDQGIERFVGGLAGRIDISFAKQDLVDGLTDIFTRLRVLDDREPDLGRAGLGEFVQGCLPLPAPTGTG